ncbi:hypothetical protein VNO80_19462 [Phaseolus coccineus]|uniref:Uncharacterized protein n=1 Tax=Phaseolus coccineus TaxID=3886 RepID=A0AAN9R094_PHACN
MAGSIFPMLFGAAIYSMAQALYKASNLDTVAISAATISDFYNWAMFVLLIPFASPSERPFCQWYIPFFVLFCYLVLRPFLTKLLNKKIENNERCYVASSFASCV